MSDTLEYGTGDNPNPADITADVSGRPKADWESRYLDAREQQIIEQPWYPGATGQPGPPPNRRNRAFIPDEGDFQASISPPAWDCTPTMNVPQSGGNLGPVQIVQALPGKSTVTVINTGANPVVISPTPDKAFNSVGITIPANGGTFTMSCQGPAYAYATGGISTVEVWWTYYESPTTHLPPKDKD